MSINRNRQKLKQSTCSNDYKKIWLDYLYPKYWDEGYYLLPRYRRGFHNPNKYIFSYQVRMYKTWKYNRRTQFKT